MNALIIALVAWSGAASALDQTPPASAIREFQSCETSVEGVAYDGQAQLKGNVKTRSHFEGARLTWTDGDDQFVVTSGERSVDRPAKIETFLRTRVTPVGAGEHEDIELTISSVAPDGSTDFKRAHEANDYAVNGNVRTLGSRWVDGEEVPHISETISTVAIPNGRQVTTVEAGPFTERTSDDGSFTVVSTRTRVCTMTRSPEA